MFEKELMVLSKGFEIDKFQLILKKELPGRIADEKKFELYLKHKKNQEFLMYLKVFGGRRKYYLPFIELFGINSGLPGVKFNYFDSKIESKLLELLSKPLPPGGKIFVTYEGDPETARGLNIGLPPPVTRLGYLLFNNNFSWFKDWYFPEGGSEGSQKLQGEKPLNQTVLKKHRKGIINDIDKFLADHDGTDPETGEIFIRRATNRAEVIKDKLEFKIK
jgi:hypothetical protein